MAGSIAPYEHTLKIDRIAMMWHYPRLRELPPEAWESMLSKARDTDFDTAEWVATPLPYDSFIYGTTPRRFNPAHKEA